MLQYEDSEKYCEYLSKIILIIYLFNYRLNYYKKNYTKNKQSYTK